MDLLALLIIISEFVTRLELATGYRLEGANLTEKQKPIYLSVFVERNVVI